MSTSPVLSTHGPRPRFTAWIFPCPCSAETRLCSVAHSQLLLRTKRKSSYKLSSCRVIKLSAWGPVLLRAGQRGSVGVHNSSVRKDLLVLTSFPLSWRWCPRMWLSQLWHFGHKELMMCPGSCRRSAQSHNFLAPLVTGKLQTHKWHWRRHKEGLCSLRTHESADEREGWVATGMRWGRRKRRDLVPLWGVDQGQKISFFTERRYRDWKRKIGFESELRARMFECEDQK